MTDESQPTPEELPVIARLLELARFNDGFRTFIWGRHHQLHQEGVQ